MFIKDLRFYKNEETGGKILLQARYADFYADASGAVCGETPATDWVDVPLFGTGVSASPKE